MKPRTRLTFFAPILLLSLVFVSHLDAAPFRAAGIAMNKHVRPMKEIKQENVVIQTLDYTCGAAGLSTILTYYLDDPIPEANLLLALDHIVPAEKAKERGGFTLLDLKKLSEELGYKATGYKMSMDFLRDLKHPVLVPIKFREFRHFVIVRGVLGDRVFISDPTAGNVTLKVDQFERMWLRGIGMVIEPQDPVENQEYALRVSKEDVILADYELIRRLADQAFIRSAIYPTEF